MTRNAGPLRRWTTSKLLDEMWGEPSGDFSQTDIEAIDLGKPR
ncbi:hypothetical protein [Pseudorhizobium banfieldiae]|nr:hypothetical protein [Pseudorhizobium banfieldiae]